MRCLITGASGYIGTRLVEDLQREAPRTQLVNVDIESPRCANQQAFYRHANILDLARLHVIFQEFKPDLVIHLAAECTFNKAYGLEAYRANIEGTRNVLDAIKATPSVRRVFITSTTFVCQPGYFPKHDEDFSPHTVYGQSKVISEKITREAQPKCTWAIIRPGIIWGPGKWTQHVTMLRLMRQKRYWHPGRRAVIRPMGYIGNATYEIRKLALEAPAENIHGRVFYVCDPPTDLYEWVNECSKQLLGRPVRVAPRSLISCVAVAGDLIKWIGGNFPLTTFRFKNMTGDYRVPVDRTLDLVGPLPYSMQTAVGEWVKWYRQTYESSSSGVQTL